jgi:hypothetical protein
MAHAVGVKALGRGGGHGRAVGHRDLVLDQSMIMAALDNALDNRAIQRDFARDPVSWAAHTYLSIETMSLR